MSSNDVISWGGTEQQFRADDAEMDFKNLSIREIDRQHLEMATVRDFISKLAITYENMGGLDQFRNTIKYKIKY